ncbi:imidazole glycerol phosphate synthase subunit HisH [Altererythrobacter rubellus]|uniref:Imidazole glycerol phosphate synthase subunit HisH n=1 Tax=Altererythrobacter rubellus TaxID=2173831 RepID=A0A9Y2B8E5_9SPHN|nr:imidazole glycerol phosphate synthase subunit HisH [Altererythrobacter rubellus]WIW95940.1 imidazole glycerol phosphate synthase subunit HisH [Altererythrobacter rubellus]
MMTKSVAIVDYGAGNLLSVRRAFEKVGATVALASRFGDIMDADYLVLPGVGAFRDGMAGLRQNGLDEAVLRFADAGKPLLGICLGMQMLASESEEFGSHNGLDLIPGKVRAIPAAGRDGPLHKIPFIGWARLNASYPGAFEGSPLAGLGEDSFVYLVHSFHVEPEDARNASATYDYDGIKVTAAIQKANIFGCQFHPEKSGPVGLHILRSFLES